MTRSLGPSNDDSPQVRLEMIAADRIAGIASHGGGESDVWCDDETTEFAGGPWQDQFNAALWSWDISRPLAEQFAETPADDDAAAMVQPPGNAAGSGSACTCGHDVEEHGNDPEFPGSTACGECPEGDCIAYESDGAP